MSHGGGGGGFGHGGGVTHGGGHHGVHGGGHPDQLPSWNSAMQGGKRSGRFANFSPKPIFFALAVFSVMLVPFVLDWDNPVLQRMLIGHDLTAKDIAHQNAVNQAVAGTMRSQASRFLGSEAADALVPEPVTGRSLIAEPSPQAVQEMGGMSALSAGQNGGAGGSQIANFSLNAGDAGQLMPAQAQPLSPIGGGAYLGTNQRFISQPVSQPVPQPMGFAGGSQEFARSNTEYQGPRHKVIVDR